MSEFSCLPNAPEQSPSASIVVNRKFIYSNFQPADSPNASRQRIMPNPKLKLPEQVREVLPLKHDSLHTERSYQNEPNPTTPPPPSPWPRSHSYEVTQQKGDAVARP
jgi:hypothetical protein